MVSEGWLESHLDNVRAGCDHGTWSSSGNVYDDARVFIGIANGYGNSLLRCITDMINNCTRMVEEDSEKFPRP